MIRRVLITFFIWLCLFVPFYCGINYIEHSSATSVKECMMTFLNTENKSITQTLGFQINNDIAKLKLFAKSVSPAVLENNKLLDKHVSDFIKKQNGIFSVKIADKSGSLIYTSDKYDNSDFLADPEFKIANTGKVAYTLYNKEQPSKNIIISYLFSVHSGEKQLFFKFNILWKQYHTYLSSIKQGTFPRFFYVLSPNFTRYINLDGMFVKNSQKRLAVSLGCHLAKDLQQRDLKENTILFKKYDIPFVINIAKINLSNNIVGPELYSVIATDSLSIGVLASELLDGINGSLILVIVITLILACILGYRYCAIYADLLIAKSIKEATPLPVIIFELDSGKIIQTNEPACVLFKATNDKFVQINAWSLFINDKDKKYIQNAVNSAIPIHDYELLLQEVDGGTFWSIISVTSLSIDSKLCVVIGLYDISHRKEIEKKMEINTKRLEQQILDRTKAIEAQAHNLENSNKQLAAAKLEAEKANEAKTKFLTNISSELKTPLNAIIDYSDVLIEEAKQRHDEVSASDLRRIIGAANHLLAIINEIMKLPDIEEGKIPITLENFEILDAIKDVDGVARPLFMNNDNLFTVDCPEDLGAMHCDQTKLRQCLLNLLDNSAKYTKQGEVTLRVRDKFDGDINYIEFLVRDNGIGMSTEQVDNILANMESNSEDVGINLYQGGLLITQKYCKLLGGKMIIDSEINEGTNISILLPRICTIEQDTLNSTTLFNKKKDRNDIDETLLANQEENCGEPSDSPEEKEGVLENVETLDDSETNVGNIEVLDDDKPKVENIELESNLDDVTSAITDPQEISGTVESNDKTDDLKLENDIANLTSNEDKASQKSSRYTSIVFEDNDKNNV